jgi:hypothetical protein
LLIQIFFGPFANALFLTYSVASNGGGVTQIKEKFENDYINIMKTNITVCILLLFFHLKVFFSIKIIFF